MASPNLSPGAQNPPGPDYGQNSPGPDYGQNSPEPKRRKLNDLGDDNHPNADIESEVDGTGKEMEGTDDGSEEYMDNDAFLAWLEASTSDPSKRPTDKIFPWDFEADHCIVETLEDDPMRWAGCHCSICGNSNVHPTVFCPYLQFFPEDGKLAPNAPATIVGILSGKELKQGPGRAVIDMSKLRER